jgi:hypothetical protein
MIILVHTFLGNVILWVPACMPPRLSFHHFYLRDGVFRSMAPGG